MGNGRNKWSKDGQALLGSETRGEGLAARMRRSLAEEASWVIVVTQVKLGQIPQLHKYIQAINRCLQTRSFRRINKATVFCVCRQLLENTHMHFF